MGLFSTIGKIGSHAIGFAKDGFRQVGNAVANHGDAIDLVTGAMTLGGAAMVATGIGAPIGAGMMAASKGISLAQTGINVASGHQSWQSAATGLAAGYVMGQGMKVVGSKIGGRVGKIAEKM
tara:strand:+ start:1864 stop:2229 length:366 start_codon:yes stop_codon:yes gene_type:complete